jgi:hypothetical protein
MLATLRLGFMTGEIEWACGASSADSAGLVLLFFALRKEV